MIRRLLFLAAFGVVSTLATAPGATEGPHGALDAPEMCAHCHVDDPVPPRGPYRFRRDIVSLCVECHQEKDVSNIHPVDIRPGVKVPADLPLDAQGTITCATCHNPHRAPEASEPYVTEPIAERLMSMFTGENRYRTYFLRRRNDRGQLCLSCHPKGAMTSEGFHAKEASVIDRYAGSESCGRCHPEVYDLWKHTPHARMARDPARDPEAVLADFETSPPFERASVVYVLGSHWTQRYVVRKQGQLYVKAPIWWIPQKKWDTSYWIDKPWGPFCAGCHTTGFEIGDEPRWAELGVGCEACHGPARAHVASGGEAPVVNPADLDPARRGMICESCHTTGHDRTGQFRFPLGYKPGRDLTRYFRGLMPKPGQDNETFSGDGSHDDRHRQWLYWVEHFLDARGLTCDICKNFRSQMAPTETARMTPSQYCRTCHNDLWHEAELHETHADAAVGCTQCHEQARAPDGGYSIHDHKFLFGPARGQGRPPRQVCGDCHGGRSAQTR